MFGTECVCLIGDIDPRRTETARKATVNVAPVPGTDWALLLAMVGNVLDAAQSLGLINGSFGPPRTYGIEFRTKF